MGVDRNAGDVEIDGQSLQESGMTKNQDLLPPIHAGEILREDFMKPLGISINRIARDLCVPVTRMSDIVNERRSITADTALRLGRYFGNSAQFWINLQKAYELELAERAVGKEIERDVRPREAGGHLL